MATLKGQVRAISVSEKRGTRKTNVPEARLKMDFGIVGDAHPAQWHRQVSLMAVESIDKMIAAGDTVWPGEFVENITTEGINLLKLSIGTKPEIGSDTEVELTQIGKECHSRCEILERVGDCIMPREGVFARVTKPGAIKVGDGIEVLND